MPHIALIPEHFVILSFDFNLLDLISSRQDFKIFFFFFLAEIWVCDKNRFLKPANVKPNFPRKSKANVTCHFLVCLKIATGYNSTML